MSQKIPTIIIGIPAFNEESNIAFLLKDIAKQKLIGFKIKEVVVNSDASTDQTETVALKATKLPVRVMNHKVRKGIAGRLNEIIQYAKKEKVTALVLFDADIRIQDKNCLKNLVTPILKHKADLTSCRITELSPTNLVDKSLQVSMNIKDSIFTHLNKGDNVYTCYGPVRALSAALITKLKFPYSIGNDAYTYFFAKKMKLKYQFVQKTEVIYKLPTALKDHANQSQRFLESQKLLAKDFGKNTIQNAYQIPISLKVGSLITYFVKQPVLVTFYLAILFNMRIKHVSSKGIPDMWEHVSSSKVLHTT